MDVQTQSVAMEPPRAATYEFLFQTPQGVIRKTVTAGDMKCCPCGCGLFHQVFRISHEKGSPLLGQPSMWLTVPVWVCHKCEQEMNEDGPKNDNGMPREGGCP